MVRYPGPDAEKGPANPADDQHLYLRYQDHRDGQSKLMPLAIPEFIRRFLMRVLPKGLKRIRHYGFLAYRCR